ncbi:MAG: phosphoglycerate kinase [Candidatus Omnitrophica bacterium CG08_land_8_20_14_0_20_41_16]|uniref:Phosphoglycerate kinase n=1 Tax=Candidatus Sherwoodlollariibacterium unditelluris TaxID=1974757 RepID=A0A2G9YJF5_9BACT|nr:MAG: phosphoglycerate kinase [Candidatus Omnitrophica bacterium CG23_combo_of_CG06-09_8_20_14_all_41_10]PIS33471.1 MAG: phosphoglycerate kinase [Candidatus Omnitrophica bacterium CG08_land_8_20_14_0_20_41_16]
MAKLTVKDLDFKNKTVLMRADFNVPQDASLTITDDTRIRATLPTIKYILGNGVKKLVLMSHLGRPDGKVVAKYSLKSVAVRLKELLGEDVLFLTDCVGDNIKKDVDSSKERVVLLENLRFHAEEEADDANFSKQLACLGEIFVNDAFGSAHRSHASTEGVTHYLKSAAGFLVEKEILYLGGAVENPTRPFMVILGGAKVSDKIGVIENLLPKADALIVGGGMAYTFLKAEGKSIGSSKLEKEKLGLAKSCLRKAKRLRKAILLPVDNLVVEVIAPSAKSEIVGVDIPDGKIAVDIGPKTIKLFEDKLKSAKTIVWNGPLGIFEIDAFSRGTEEIAKFIANLECTSIIGGGDTAAAIAKFKLEGKMTHISTGGGASLEFLEGKVLPGIAALSDR